MATLVTGGAGFIGSHVAEKLLQKGDTVVILDNFNDYYDPDLKHRNIQRLDQYPNLTVIKGDIRDIELVKSIFAEHAITRIAHLAAMAGVRESVNQVRLYVDVNVNGTMNLLEHAREYGINMFVIASTSSVYGKTEILPFIETDMADRPLAAYPASKRAAELIAHTYHNLVDMNITILRFFNVYGPAGRPDMMPLRLLEAAFSGEEIPIFNNGEIHRDWTYIDDTVNGVVAALERPLGYEVINLGCGEPLSLTDFVEAIEELTGREINKKIVPTPPSDPPITYCNNDKAKRLLDFQPQTNVIDGLAKTWYWYRETYQK